MNYSEFVSCLGIGKGDSIWLSSEIIRLALKVRNTGEKFDSNLLIDEIQKALGEKGTLLIPTFSFEFSNKGYYDIIKSKGTTGALGNVALQRKDFTRTKHPMHSFAVWGKDKELLVGMNNLHSFGIDSPFAYCMRNKVKQIILGTDYVHAMTFVHYAEVVCGVPYRFSKSFEGIYVDENGVVEKRKYDYAARMLEIRPEEKFNLMGKILEEKGTSRIIDVNGICCYSIDLAKSFPYICDDIINNKCRNIYDFNVSREDIFGE